MSLRPSLIRSHALSTRHAYRRFHDSNEPESASERIRSLKFKSMARYKHKLELGSESKQRGTAQQSSVPSEMRTDQTN